ncbi:protein GrpE [Sphaerisporangium rufum]|uniref:Protein GrpE n=1 Tax=Sphaerisporangium rufum TaxID=1381558 RepID=A0A919RA50_9ACTN|nr:nucleotide exchange factor GrpE [Sphaerisporangium rufum]GII80122.1 protein GrpE [Sphaerisporangium rufum]
MDMAGPGHDAAAVPPDPTAETIEADEGTGAAVDELIEKIAGLEDRWLRSVAELDNVRKRLARDIERARGDERVRLLREWLPVVDNLDLALRHAGADPGAMVEGVRAVRDQAVALLARLGHPRHDETGVPFDPAAHEAVGTRADPGVPPGTVVEVVRPGYGDPGAQLRPAAVIVSTSPD